MFKRSLIAFAVFLVSLGSPFFPYGQQHTDSQTQEHTGNGVYRPLNLFRQLKLGTAYFVNPSLPGKAHILNAYTPRGLLEALNALDENSQSSNPQEDGNPTTPEKHWLAIQLPGQPAFTFTIPCQAMGQPPESEISPTSNLLCAGMYSFQSDARLEEWLRSLPDNGPENIYVLSPQLDFVQSWSSQCV